MMQICPRDLHVTKLTFNINILLQDLYMILGSRGLTYYVMLTHFMKLMIPNSMFPQH